MRKLKAQKYMHNINDNAVQDRLSEIYLTRKIIARNILDMKYSRFTVYKASRARPAGSRVRKTPVLCLFP